MDHAILDAAIYEKYIRPTQRTRKKYVGVEVEMPLVHLIPDGEGAREIAPVDFDLIHEMTSAFIAKFGFTSVHRDDEGHIFSAQDPVTGDDLSYDCSYNTLELSFGLITDIHELERRFELYVGWIQAYLKPHQHLLTGMGVNPGHAVNHDQPVPNGRYRMLFHHLKSYKKYEGEGEHFFHDEPSFGLFSCASQVQLDVEEEMLPEVLHTFSKLEPIKAILFSNSLWGETHKILCARDWFWKYSLHGLNPHNVDMYEVALHDTEELIEYIKTMSMFCVERGEKYINFAPIPLLRYMDQESIEGEYFDGTQYRTIRFKPVLQDLKWLRSYKFVDLTFRGTLEFRSMCCQPLSETLTPAAFHAGLMEMVPELEVLLDEDRVLYHHGYNPSELRAMFVTRHYPEWADKEQLTALILRILDLAKEGLRRRGFGEESYLAPLYDRARTLMNPAMAMADGLDAGKPVAEFVTEYAKLKS